MSFFEDIATSLDNAGIESRVNDDVMFVPITSGIEIQFIEIDADLPAANVYIANAVADDEEELFDSALVSVVFSVDDAVKTVLGHIATDQVVTVLQDLLDGTDERIADLEFFHDPFDARVVYAGVTHTSVIRVCVESEETTPTASVVFIALGEELASYANERDEVLASLHNIDGATKRQQQKLLYDIASHPEDNEVLELGTFDDWDKLFDVLSLAADQGADWESQLVPFDEYDDDYSEYEVFDISDYDEIEIDDIDEIAEMDEYADDLEDFEDTDE
ncbi:hypothetical protein EML15_07455 [Corynebacterium sp. sy017]|uniref:hypothetical protein n=1 Tax=unclassified Corynebacterium TaxID=2624378 RepID=UPI001185CB44|nr:MULTISPECIES: hypothetical protein [unclassified Corynebacterium]MBP3088979.1 hypothetical protein [Corynebacterium sp. sy017]QDZ42348.1 hypothetical protein FQV43_03615 [Corynebacterium sp. sy039]TSD91302.1 hypothetical protein ELY17_07465 [Corynebacterium sp. SY003]